MKILNSAELGMVSGGFDGVTALCVLSAANVALGIYNFSQLSELREGFEFVYNWTYYHEAQLATLPKYKEISALNLGQVYDLVS